MWQITDLLKSAQRNIDRGDNAAAHSDLQLALALARAYTNPSMVKHRCLRGHIATAIEQFNKPGLKERRLNFLEGL